MNFCRQGYPGLLYLYYYYQSMTTDRKTACREKQPYVHVETEMPVSLEE